MSIDKAVDSTQLNTDLTSVANAIRTKGGTSASLAFPAGFVQAIGDIPSGGISIDDIATNTLPSETIRVNATTIGQYAFAGKPITKIIAPNATRMAAYALMNTLIQNVIPSDFPVLEGSLRGFSDMPELLSIKLTSAVNLNDGSGSIKNAKKLISAEFPNAQAGQTGTAAMQGCTNLELMDLGNTSKIWTNCFYQCPSLRTLILRSSSVCALSKWNQSVMAGIYSNPTASTVYVPSNLIEQYKVATNWSTAFGAGLSFVAIEGSAYE